MKRKIFLLLIIVFFANLFLIAFASENTIINYSKTENWLFLPSRISKKVDIFYLYPTAWDKINKNDPNICEINNPIMLKKTKLLLKTQAEAFSPVGNIYAPYYRQADACYVLALPSDQQEKFLSGIPKSDTFAAFDYYIKNYNNGRPFILVSHSQGSAMMVTLLSEYMKANPKVYDRMIAAYVIGYPVTKDYLDKNRHLKFAQNDHDIGVIISYNVEAPDIDGINPMLKPNTFAINPLNWTREEIFAPAKKNLGSIVCDEKENITIIKHYADAKVNKRRGTVICTSVDPEKLLPGMKEFPKGVYHSFEYKLYYYNLRENAAKRANVFLKTHKL